MRSDLAGLVAVVGVALLTMPLYRYGPSRGRPDADGAKRGGTFLLGRFVRDWFYWFISPVERIALALRLDPLFFNVLGVLVAMVSGLLLWRGHLVAGGWTILLGSVADIFDGRIARALDVASPRGAFLDSTLDRFAETAVFVGLAAWYPETAARAVIAAALGGSLLVSYTRARGESLNVLCKLGIMQRAERIIALGFGALLDPAISDAWGRPHGSALLVVLWLVAAGTLGTAVFRTVWIAQRLPSRQSPRSHSPRGRTR